MIERGNSIGCSLECVGVQDRSVRELLATRSGRGSFSYSALKPQGSLGSPDFTPHPTYSASQSIGGGRASAIRGACGSIERCSRIAATDVSFITTASTFIRPPQREKANTSILNTRFNKSAHGMRIDSGKHPLPHWHLRKNRVHQVCRCFIHAPTDARRAKRQGVCNRTQRCNCPHMKCNEHEQNPGQGCHNARRLQIPREQTRAGWCLDPPTPTILRGSGNSVGTLGRHPGSSAMNPESCLRGPWSRKVHSPPVPCPPATLRLPSSVSHLSWAVR